MLITDVDHFLPPKNWPIKGSKVEQLKLITPRSKCLKLQVIFFEKRQKSEEKYFWPFEWRNGPLVAGKNCI